MTVFLLSDDLVFPPPEIAEKNGLLAVGGDLSEERLLLAYAKGIFPWFSEHSPILWWSPDPRLVLLPGKMNVARSLGQLMKKGVFTVTIDNAFEKVIRHCADVHREKDSGTWITEEMIDAYKKLHISGYAHSVETWHAGELVGGLYGVALGKAFFGESMFSTMSNASKVALAGLARLLNEWEYRFIDCQVTSKHLISLGAREMRRTRFLKILEEALKSPTDFRQWRTAKEVRLCAGEKNLADDAIS